MHSSYVLTVLEMDKYMIDIIIAPEYHDYCNIYCYRCVAISQFLDIDIVFL